MYQMLQAPRYWHLRRITYRDLLLQNVSIDVNRSVVKLADLGLPKSFGYPLLTLIHGVVTLLYRSSEILLGEAVDCCDVDVLSMGCMFVEMTMGDPLVQQALLHVHFANLDERSLPVVGEEHVGLPICRIPPDFAEPFNALVNII
ncbi:Cyclin-dependent kinase 2 [Taenia solium]